MVGNKQFHRFEQVELTYVHAFHNRQSKMMEFALVQDNSSYLDALKSASGYLETASEDLQTIRADLETKLERAHKDREIQLEIREKKISDQQKHFEKLRDATEMERVALLELVKTLEIKLNSVTQVYVLSIDIFEYICMKMYII